MKISNGIAKKRAEMKLRRGLFRKRSRGWKCMETMVMTLAGRSLGIEKAGGMEAIPSGCRLGKEHESPEYDNGITEPTFAEIFEKEGGTAAGLDLGYMVVYYPEIPKLKANGECGIIPPTFQGKTIQIIGGFSIADILEVGITTRGRKEIHGTIMAKCTWLDSIMLFDRTAYNPQIVHGEDSLELTRPRFGMPASKPLEIKANIVVGEDEIVDMNISWRPLEQSFDMVYHKESKCGTRGSSLHLSYVVYEKAVVAFIEITFLPRCPVEICGLITSHNNMFPHWKSVLFCKEKSSGEHLRAELGEQKLTLLRSITPVPIYNTPNQKMDNECYWDEIDEINSYNGCLHIGFNLTNILDQRTIAEGDLEFPIKKYGDCIGMIYGMYGVMQVKVSFVIHSNILPSS